MLYPRMSKGAKLNMEKAPKNVRKALRLNARRYAILQKTLDKIERDEKRAAIILDEKFKTFLNKPSVGRFLSREYNVLIKVETRPKVKSIGATPVLKKSQKYVGMTHSRVELLRDQGRRRKGDVTIQSRTRVLRDKARLGQKGDITIQSRTGILRDKVRLGRKGDFTTQSHPEFRHELTKPQAQSLDDNVKSGACDSQPNLISFPDLPDDPLCSKIQSKSDNGSTSSVDILRVSKSCSSGNKPANLASPFSSENRVFKDSRYEPIHSLPSIANSTRLSVPTNKIDKKNFYQESGMGVESYRHWLPYISQKRPGFLVKGTAVIYNVRC